MVQVVVAQRVGKPRRADPRECLRGSLVQALGRCVRRRQARREMPRLSPVVDRMDAVRDRQAVEATQALGNAPVKILPLKPGEVAEF